MREQRKYRTFKTPIRQQNHRHHTTTCSAIRQVEDSVSADQWRSAYAASQPETHANANNHQRPDKYHTSTSVSNRENTRLLPILERFGRNVHSVQHHSTHFVRFRRVVTAPRDAPSQTIQCMKFHIIHQVKQVLVSAVFDTHITPHVRAVEPPDTNITITHFKHLP